MIFGGLSEKEIKLISKLLDANNINYNVQTDNIIKESNDKSIKFDLRHLNSPSISTHVLAIEIADEDFSKMSHSLEKDLLEFGITNKVPEEFIETKASDPLDVHDEVRKGNSRLIGFDFGLQIALGVIVIVAIGLAFINNTTTHSINDTRFHKIEKILEEFKTKKFSDKVSFTDEQLSSFSKVTSKKSFELLKLSIISFINSMPVPDQEMIRFVEDYDFVRRDMMFLSQLDYDTLQRMINIDQLPLQKKLELNIDKYNMKLESYRENKSYPRIDPKKYEQIQYIMKYLKDFEFQELSEITHISSMAMIMHIYQGKTDFDEIKYHGFVTGVDSMYESEKRIKTESALYYNQLTLSELRSYYGDLVSYKASSLNSIYIKREQRIFYEFINDFYSKFVDK